MIYTACKRYKPLYKPYVILENAFVSDNSHSINLITLQNEEKATAQQIRHNLVA